MKGYFYLQGKVINHASETLVKAIGFHKYKQWKQIDALFHVKDAVTAVDLAVQLYCDVNILDVNRSFADHLLKHWGVNEDYLLIYCIQREVDFDVKKSEIVTHLKPIVKGEGDHSLVGVWDHYVEGHGPNLLMSLSNLHYELTTTLHKSFIPL